MTIRLPSPCLLSPCLALLLAGPVAAQPEEPSPRREPVRPAGPALISVYRSTAARPCGLYLRESGGKTRQVWVGQPYDARALPDGSTLVCERAKGRLLRLDPEGRVLFERTGLPQPVDAEEAPDGTLVVVLNGSGEVAGLHPESGAVLWRRGGFRNHYDVLPLPDGGILVADSGNGRVVELDAQGATRLEVPGLGFPNTVDRLPNGRTLVTTYHQGEVLELDAEGRVVWKARVAGTIFRAVRRSDGDTVLVEGEIAGGIGRIHVVARDGRVRLTETFQPGCVDFEPLDGI